MKPESKRPVTWVNPQPQVMAMTFVTNPNRERIDAKIAELKAKKENK